MALIDFFRKKNLGDELAAKYDKKFVGRHQWAYVVKTFLDESLINNLENQIAKNKDERERSGVIKQLEEIEAYIKSDFFTSPFDVFHISDEIRKLILEGQETCVLQNDSGLYERCLKVLDDTIQYSKNLAKKGATKEQREQIDDGKFDEEIKLRQAMGFMRYTDLAGLLTTGEEQQMWLVISCVAYPDKKLLKNVLATLDLPAATEMSDQVRKLSRKMLEEKNITIDDIKQVDDQISEGLIEGKDLRAGKFMQTGAL